MATIIEQVDIAADPAIVWDALRDFGALHERLVPGFVVRLEVDGDTRRIEFFNGVVATEALVGLDDDAMRLAYRLIETPLPITHHNGSAQVVPDGAGHCRFVWITDVQPDALAEYIAPLMAQGIAVIKETMERAAATA